MTKKKKWMKHYIQKFLHDELINKQIKTKNKMPVSFVICENFYNLLITFILTYNKMDNYRKNR